MKITSIEITVADIFAGFKGNREQSSVLSAMDFS